MPKDTYYGQPVFKLEEKWVQKLADLPETGMGYQEVEVRLKDGSIVRAIVGNCEYIMHDVQFVDDDIIDITMRGQQ